MNFIEIFVNPHKYFLQNRYSQDCIYLKYVQCENFRFMARCANMW